MNIRAYELFQYEGGIRIPKIGPLGPFRLGGRETPFYINDPVVLHGYFIDGTGKTPVELAIRHTDRVDVARSWNGYSYLVSRSVPLGPIINKDPDLGGRVGFRRFTPW